MSEITLAIDFGTSNSLVGAYRRNSATAKSDKNLGRVEALPIDPTGKDPTLMRTLLYFPDADSCYYGQEAMNRFIENDLHGRLFRSFKSHLPNQSYLGTVVEGRIVRLEDMVGLFLLEIKKRSEKILGQKISRAVIGRPARYSMDPVSDGFAIHRMQKAAEFAGFTEVQFVPEPLAAALEYNRSLTEEKIVVVGDFGGGTSDFTLMRMSPKGFNKKDVLGVDGCPLSGDALDSSFMASRLNLNFGAQVKYRMPMSDNVLTMPKSITERLNKPAHIVHLKERDTYSFIKEVEKCAIRAEDKKAVQRLFVLMEDQQIFPFFEEIERTKQRLSAKSTAHFDFDYPDIETHEVFSRQEFETWNESTKAQIFAALDRCLEQGGMKPEQVDHVFLTGGTAHVPFVRTELENRFGAQKLHTKQFFHSVLSGLIESAREWE